MVAKAKTEKELADAIKREEDTIEIEGDFAKKIFKIRATGNVAWAVAAGAIGIAILGLLRIPTTRGTSGVVAGFSAAGAVGILGAGTAYCAISLAKAAGGIGVLTKIREYKQVSYAENRLVLQRK